MKSKIKLFALAFVLLISYNSAFSQTRFGVRAALNSSNLDAKSVSTSNSIAAPQVGIVTYTNFKDSNFFLQSGLFYNMKGFEQTVNGEKSKLRYNFVELPVNLGYNLPIGNLFTIQPYVGAFVGYAFSGKIDVGGKKHDIFKNDLDKVGVEKFEAKRVDYGVNGGVGLKLGNSIILNGQYSHGLSNLGHSDAKIRSRTTSFGVTYLF